MSRQVVANKQLDIENWIV